MKSTADMQDDYVEVEPASEAAQSAPAKMEDNGDADFERRMDNWRAVVRSPSSKANYCASWARLYLQARSRGMQDDLLVNFADAAPTVTNEELDGWLVEAAVRMLPDFSERRALQMWYVWRYPEHWIKGKLMLRRGAVRLVLARARTNLKKILNSAERGAIVRFNNLHAGEDPRLATDICAPKGSALPAKK